MRKAQIFQVLTSPFKGVRGMFRAVCFSVLLVTFSCNETKEIDLSTLGYDYYPIEFGQYKIYDVEEIIYEVIGFDTSVYQLRETIFDSIISPDQITYLLRVDRRDNPASEWKANAVWTVTKTDNYLSVNENNVPFLKLTFPAKIGAEWDGNSLNSQIEITYYYQKIDNALIDSIAVEDHLRVIIEDIPQNIVNQDLRSEVYVRGIGLISKDYLTLNYCTANCTQLGEIQSGRSLKQTLIEIGNE